VQEYLPDEIKEMRFYAPGDNAREREMRKQLNTLWKGKYGY